MINKRGVLITILALFCINSYAKPNSDKDLKDWVINEVDRLSSKNLTSVENVNFGQLILNTERVKRKNITVFDGHFSDSSVKERLVCIKTTKNQRSGVGMADALTLLIKCQDGNDCYAIVMGRPSPTFTRSDLIDLDNDGFLDVYSQTIKTKNTVIKKQWVEVYSLKNNKILYQSFAVDKWTEASTMQKLLVIDGDALYETLEVKKCSDEGTTKLIETRSTYYCNGGETVSQIKKKMKVVKASKVIIFNEGQIAITTSGL